MLANIIAFSRCTHVVSFLLSFVFLSPFSFLPLLLPPSNFLSQCGFRIKDWVLISRTWRSLPSNIGAQCQNGVLTSSAAQRLFTVSPKLALICGGWEHDLWAANARSIFRKISPFRFLGACTWRQKAGIGKFHGSLLHRSASFRKSWSIQKQNMQQDSENET